MKEDQFLISILVSNHFGVLARIASLFSKRGYNIDSLTVGETADCSLSRMTIVSTGDEYIRTQMARQLEKLVDVKCVQVMNKSDTIVRELLLLKVFVDKDKRSEIMRAFDVFRAKIVDLSPESVSVELTGEPDKLNALIDYMRDYNIVELSRTGVTALGRNGYCLSEKDGSL
ncbi:MAG: acetolactate synthase small subunit [Clostridia bacterium]|nr:acetolactate synthase small subunit [Clostridia bacterium]